MHLSFSSAYEDGSIVAKTGFRYRGLSVYTTALPPSTRRTHCVRLSNRFEKRCSYELRALFRDLLDSRRQVAAATIKTNTAMYISSVEPSPTIRRDAEQSLYEIHDILVLFTLNVLRYRHHPGAAVPCGTDERAILLVEDQVCGHRIRKPVREPCPARA